MDLTWLLALYERNPWLFPCFVGCFCLAFPVLYGITIGHDEPPTQALRHPAVPGADNGHTVRAPHQGAQPRAGRP